eukprot:521320_1
MGGSLCAGKWYDEEKEYRDIRKSVTDETDETEEEKYQDCKFILQDQCKPTITRLNYNREMLIGRWEGKIIHTSVFICYFSRIDNKLVARVFCIELLLESETKKNILSIKGPIYSTRDYKCKEFYIAHMSMNSLINIAKTTMNVHGKYEYISNNCRHFTNRFLKNIKKSCKLLKVDLKVNVVNEYIHTYGGDDKKNIKKNKELNEEEKYDKEDYLEVYDIQSIHRISNDVQSMSFIQVLNEFPSTKS